MAIFLLVFAGSNAVDGDVNLETPKKHELGGRG